MVNLTLIVLEVLKEMCYPGGQSCKREHFTEVRAPTLIFLILDATHEVSHHFIGLFNNNNKSQKDKSFLPQ